MPVGRYWSTAFFMQLHTSHSLQALRQAVPCQPSVSPTNSYSNAHNSSFVSLPNIPQNSRVNKINSFSTSPVGVICIFRKTLLFVLPNHFTSYP